MFIRNVLSVTNFAKKFSSSSYGNCLLGCSVFQNFFYRFGNVFRIFRIIWYLLPSLFEYCLILHILSLKYLEEISKSLGHFPCLFSNWWGSLMRYVFNHLFIFWLKYFFFVQLLQSYFSLEILIFSWVVKFLEKIQEFCLKLDFVFFHQSLAKRVVVFCVFNNKSRFCLEFVIFSWVYSHQSHVEEWLFFVFLTKKMKSLCCWGELVLT